jgi:hypothetical protein
MTTIRILVKEDILNNRIFSLFCQSFVLTETLDIVTLNCMGKLPRESGQALLLVLLSMAVVLTVVLSVVARSVTDISVTTQEEAALRAFSAAEAGIEKALFIGSSVTGDFGDARFNATVTGVSSMVSEFVYPIGLSAGESQTIWFTNHDDEGRSVCTSDNPCFTGTKFKVCWGSSATISATTPAVEISVFYTTTPEDYSTTKIARVTADPYQQRRDNGVGGDAANNFDDPTTGSCTIGGKIFPFQKEVTFSQVGIPSSAYTQENGLQFARVRMFYNSDADSEIGVFGNFAGNALLPPQGMSVASTGTAGEANRKVEVFQGFGEAPSIFDGAIYSPSGITHQ